MTWHHFINSVLTRYSTCSAILHLQYSTNFTICIINSLFIPTLIKYNKPDYFPCFRMLSLRVRYGNGYPGALAPYTQEYKAFSPDSGSTLILKQPKNDRLYLVSKETKIWIMWKTQSTRMSHSMTHSIVPNELNAIQCWQILFRFLNSIEFNLVVL